MSQGPEPVEADHTVGNNRPDETRRPRVQPGPPDIGEVGAESEKGTGFSSIPGAGPNPTGGVERR